MREWENGRMGGWEDGRMGAQPATYIKLASVHATTVVAVNATARPLREEVLLGRRKVASAVAPCVGEKNMLAQ